MKYEAYKNQTLEEIFNELQLENAVTSEIEFLETAIMINNGDNTFAIQGLPIKAQYAPVYTSKTYDFNGDGHLDILLAGNLHAAKPQVGKYDANHGILLLGDGKGNFSEIDKAKGGMNIDGEVRDMQIVGEGENQILLLAMNDEAVKAFKF